MYVCILNFQSLDINDFDFKLCLHCLAHFGKMVYRQMYAFGNKKV